MLLRFNLLFFIICWAHFASGQSTFQLLLESGDVLLRNPKLNEKGDLLYLQGVSVSDTQRKAYLTQLDTHGKIRWAKSVGQAAFSSNVVDIIPVSDGIIAPLSEIVPSDKNAYFLVKMDTLGKEIWNIRLADNTPSSAPLIVEDTQKQLWFAFDMIENNISKTIIGKVSESGKINFMKSYFPATTTLINAIAWSEQTQTLIFTSTVSDAGSPRHVVGAIDSNGKVRWAWRAMGFRFSSMNLFDSKIVLYSVKTSFQATDILSIHDILTGKVLTTKSLDDVKCLSSNQKTLILQYGNYDLAVAYSANFLQRWAYKYPTCTPQGFVEMNINKNDDYVIWKKFLDKVLITKPDKNGLLPTCSQTPLNPPALITILDKNFVDFKNTYQVSDFPMPTNTQGILLQNITTFSSKSFCPEFPLANFSVPDTTCVKRNVTPLLVANSSFLDTWIYDDNKIDKKQNPILNLSLTGKSLITHIAQNGTCSDTVKHFIQVLTQPNIHFRDTTVCDMQSSPLFDFTIKGAMQYWLDGIELKLPIKRIEKEGIYKLKVSNGFCESEKSFYIKKSQIPDIQFNTNGVFCKNEPFFAKIVGFEKVIWDGKLSDTIRIIDAKPHRYEATLSNCKTEGFLKIERNECEIKVFVPTIFSPNDDGINDLLEPLGINFQVIDFQIFNRWGVLVFQGDAQKNAWNGKFRNILASEGVYTYRLTYINEKTMEKTQQNGDFLLINSF